MTQFAPYAKSIVAVLGAMVTAALAIIAPDTDLFTVLTIASAGITALGVYVIPNIQTGTGEHREV